MALSGSWPGGSSGLGAWVGFLRVLEVVSSGAAPSLKAMPLFFGFIGDLHFGGVRAHRLRRPGHEFGRRKGCGIAESWRPSRRRTPPIRVCVRCAGAGWAGAASAEPG